MEVFEKNRLKFFYSDFISYLCTLKVSKAQMSEVFLHFPLPSASAGHWRRRRRL